MPGEFVFQAVPSTGWAGPVPAPPTAEPRVRARAAALARPILVALLP